jgi:predicted nucleic acid-binding protein
MKVLFDTNIIIDIWKQDQEFFRDSFAAYDVCMLRKWETCITVTAVPDIEYLLHVRGILSKEQVTQAMDNLFSMFDIIDAQQCDCMIAKKSDMPDLEDGIIAFSAYRNRIDTIVTRNVKDFKTSPIPAITPAQFVATYKPNNIDYDFVELS